MLAAEFVTNYSYRSVPPGPLHDHPQAFRDWQLHYDLAVKLGFVLLIFMQGRRASIIGLCAMILMFHVRYWHHG
jgi:hypothetical protein